MAEFWEALKAAGKSAFCGILSTGGDIYRLLEARKDDEIIPYSGLGQNYSARYCNDPDGVPTIQAPFQGGQCCSVFYNVVIQALLENLDGSTYVQQGENGTRGKVTSVRLGAKQEDGTHAGVIATWQRCDGSTTERILIQAGRGVKEITSIQVIPLETEPEGGCGNPPPRVPKAKPNWNKKEKPVTYTNNDGVDITVPALFVFGYAKVDIDAEVHIPITVDVGGVNFNLDFNLNTGDISLFPDNDFFGDKDKGEQPRDFLPPPSGTPDSPADVPNPTLPEGGESEGGEGPIVGCVVTVTSVQRAKVSTLFQSGNPDISIPNFGYVSFFCRVGATSGAWTDDLPVKNKRHVIRCPWPAGAVKVDGTPRDGVTWDIKPIYSKKRQPTRYPEEVTA